jgi:hypothetical protein
VEFFVRIFEEDGERLADLIPANDQEGRRWLRGKVKGFSYWAISSQDPKYMVHIFYQGDPPPENVRNDWNTVIETQVLDYLSHQ